MDKWLHRDHPSVGRTKSVHDCWYCTWCCIESIVCNLFGENAWGPNRFAKKPMVVVSLYRMGWWIFNVKGKANQWFILIIIIFLFLNFCACAFPWFYFYSFVQIPITHSLAPFCELIIVITITHSVVFIFRCPPPALISVIQWKVDGFILSRLNIYTSSFFVLKLASFNLDIGMQVSKGKETQIFSNGILPPHPSHHIWTRKTSYKWTRKKMIKTI